jgi:hypothetical protein
LLGDAELPLCGYYGVGDDFALTGIASAWDPQAKEKPRNDPCCALCPLVLDNQPDAASIED